MKRFIGGAWPYANGSLHVGHIAALITGDILARYFRAIGEEVVYVSGSDCHGTPVAIRAKKEGREPSEICEKYHKEFEDSFNFFGFSYDHYGKTTSLEHKSFVEKFHTRLYESESVFEKEAPQAFCEKCEKPVVDRQVVGECPNCGEGARGDQCDHCGKVLQPEELIHPHCEVCGEETVFRKSNHLYIKISDFKEELENIVDEKTWRKNAVKFTQRYINEGLRDRALTRELEWGIDVPHDNHIDKKIYIWAENVLGYLSACGECFNSKDEFKSFWNDSEHYYVHGKDNIPFHSIILPSLLLAEGEGYKLPDRIISSEYLTLEGKKISTSRNWAIWVKDLIGRYNPDSLRYFLIGNGPEKRDTDFSWREFVNSNNGELLGAYGNFINRTLAFIKKSFDNRVPFGKLNKNIQREIKKLYINSGKRIEEGEFKAALEEIFSFIREGNKYFDEEKPWITAKEDIERCHETLYNCVYIICNLAKLLKPFIPFSSEKVLTWFNIDDSWEEYIVHGGYELPDLEILFERLDKKIVDEELEKLTVIKR